MKSLLSILVLMGVHSNFAHSERTRTMPTVPTSRRMPPAPDSKPSHKREKKSRIMTIVSDSQKVMPPIVNEPDSGELRCFGLKLFNEHGEIVHKSVSSLYGYYPPGEPINIMAYKMKTDEVVHLGYRAVKLSDLDRSQPNWHKDLYYCEGKRDDDNKFTHFGYYRVYTPTETPRKKIPEDRCVLNKNVCEFQKYNKENSRFEVFESVDLSFFEIVQCKLDWKRIDGYSSNYPKKGIGDEGHFIATPQTLCSHLCDSGIELQEESNLKFYACTNNRTVGDTIMTQLVEFRDRFLPN